MRLERSMEAFSASLLLRPRLLASVANRAGTIGGARASRARAGAAAEERLTSTRCASAATGGGIQDQTGTTI